MWQKALHIVSQNLFKTGSHSVALDGLENRNSSVPASWETGLQLCANAPDTHTFSIS